MIIGTIGLVLLLLLLQQALERYENRPEEKFERRIRTIYQVKRVDVSRRAASPSDVSKLERNAKQRYWVLVRVQPQKELRGKQDEESFVRLLLEQTELEYSDNHEITGYRVEYIDPSGEKVKLVAEKTKGSTPSTITRPASAGSLPDDF